MSDALSLGEHWPAVWGLSDARNGGVGYGPDMPLCRGTDGMTEIIRRKPSSSEEYWRASIAWQRLTLSAGRPLANAGFLTVEDLRSAHKLELAMIPRVGGKSLSILISLRA